MIIFEKLKICWVDFFPVFIKYGSAIKIPGVVVENTNNHYHSVELSWIELRVDQKYFFQFFATYVEFKIACIH